MNAVLPFPSRRPVEPEAPLLFCDSTLGDWRCADQEAGKAYALTLDTAGYVLPHPGRAGTRGIWFGLRRHGKPDHGTRLAAMHLKLTQARLKVHPEIDDGEVIGLLVLDS